MADLAMQDELIVERVVSYFLAVFQPDVTSTISPFTPESPIGLLDSNFVFSLQALYDVLFVKKKNNGRLSRIEFRTFRKAIYASNINQQLSKQGCQLLVYKSKGKLADNLYQLAALN